MKIENKNVSPFNKNTSKNCEQNLNSILFIKIVKKNSEKTSTI